MATGFRRRPAVPKPLADSERAILFEASWKRINRPVRAHLKGALIGIQGIWDLFVFPQT